MAYIRFYDLVLAKNSIAHLRVHCSIDKRPLLSAVHLLYIAAAAVCAFSMLFAIPPVSNIIVIVI